MRLSSTPILSACVWLAVVAAGGLVVWRFESTPGERAAPPERWPAASELSRDSNLPTLLMFAHPRCPCTTASLGQLERLLAVCQGRVAAQIVFVRPEGASSDWEKSSLWQRAKEIPQLAVVSDPNGTEARRFRSITSGSVLLYTPDGELRFSGGITLARGHMGDNAGQDALMALLLGESNSRVTSAVFGCPLQGPALNQTAYRPEAR